MTVIHPDPVPDPEDKQAEPPPGCMQPLLFDDDQMPKPSSHQIDLPTY